jgi:hypothetical protein
MMKGRSIRRAGLSLNLHSNRRRWALITSKLSNSTKQSPLNSHMANIGGIEFPFNELKYPNLVPNGKVEYWGERIPSEVVAHLRWIAQKMNMKQDIFLLGPPGNLRRNIILTFCDLCGLEVEYLTITRDTTESDLKQRREIIGDSAVFVDQAPVRAAIHGRVLILDGIENAERNVLPTLNNLLENREMNLEDGRFLMRKELIASIEGADNDRETSSKSIPRLIPVHPSFQVVAIGLPSPPYPGRTLDPPLRSRFQCRFIDELRLETVLECVDIKGGIDADALKAVSGLYEGLKSLRSQALAEGNGVSALPGTLIYAGVAPCAYYIVIDIDILAFSLDSFRYCIDLLKSHPETISIDKALSRVIPFAHEIAPVPAGAVESISPNKGKHSAGSRNYEVKYLPAKFHALFTEIASPARKYRTAPMTAEG